MKEKMKMENEIFIIYKAQNIVNGECYVGASTKGIEERKKDHINKSNSINATYFQEAIRTFGADAFEWEQIDTASTVNELAEKEAEYAELFANPYTAAQRGFIDEVILPRDTRRKLMKAFSMLENKTVDTPKRKHGNIPL